jgi:predicted transcriptional regulator
MKPAKAITVTLPDARTNTPFQRPRSQLLTFSGRFRGGMMKTVTLEVRTPSEVMADFVHTWKTGKAQKSARIAFATPELLWKVLTAKRWELLKALCGAGPVSVREAARRVKRDVKAVHGDITALVAAGVLNKTENGRVEFPFEAVKVEFLLKAA